MHYQFYNNKFLFNYVIRENEKMTVKMGTLPVMRYEEIYMVMPSFVSQASGFFPVNEMCKVNHLYTSMLTQLILYIYIYILVCRISPQTFKNMDLYFCFNRICW